MLGNKLMNEIFPHTSLQWRGKVRRLEAIEGELKSCITLEAFIFTSMAIKKKLYKVCEVCEYS